MNGYVCLYNGARYEVQADSAYSAKIKAVEHFKAKKPHMVSVVLAEKGGVAVTHTPDF